MQGYREPAAGRPWWAALRLRATRAVLLALACALAMAGAAAAAGQTDLAAAAPRPLSDAERQAVQLAAEYMTRGADAWWPHLASTSWLRGLGRDAALAEIETRAGTPPGSRWTLVAVPANVAAHTAAFAVEFPSGTDETLWLDLTQEAGGWKIAAVRIAAEPLDRQAAAEAGAAAGAVGAVGGTPGAAAAGGGSADSGAAGGGMARGGGALLGAGAAGVVGLLVLVAGLVLSRRRPVAAAPASPPSRGSFVAMAPPPGPWWAKALAVGGAVLIGLAGLRVATLAAGGELRADLAALTGRAKAAPAVAGGAGSTADGAGAGAGAGDASGPVALRALLPLRRAITQAAVSPGGAAAGAASGSTLAAVATAVPAPVSAVSAGAAAAAGSPAAPAQDAGAAADAALDALAAAAAPGDPLASPAGRVALVWRAQHRIDRADLAGAAALLSRLPHSRSTPLAELLRARLALLRLQGVETGVAYERAIDAGVVNEGWLLEAIGALYILGFEETAKQYLDQLAALGARGAETWYALADLALIENRNDQAHRLFRTAWQLEPLSRATLLSRELSAFMLQDRDLRRMLALGAPTEPGVVCPGESGRPLQLPAGVGARLLGGTLRLRAGTAEVKVPDACDLAPAATPHDSAVAWQEERENEALARVPELRRTAASAAALAQPVLRRQTEEAAVALANRLRWADLIEITQSLALPAAILPPDLARLRATALSHTGRDPEARQLLVRVALGDKVNRRADPGVLYQLADLVEKAGDFDSALRLVAKANSELPSPPSGDRQLQLQMEKRLASSLDQFKSQHFLVNYPTSRGPAFGKEAARILEAERKRLQQWIPIGDGGPPIDVRLLPFSDFEMGYSEGGDVLGLFDGVVRLPLGSLKVFGPFAVSILSHELAHAMLAQRTGDRAPHWFHEGLAQHIEMHSEGRVNPIGDYRDTDRLLAFPLLEPAISSFASIVWVTAAYDEALWTLNYIESRYGIAGIHHLEDEFRAGRTTPEAISHALGTPIQRFDQDLWDWCLHQAPRAYHLDLVRYDGGDADPKRF